MGMIDDVVNLVKQGPRVASEFDKVKFNTKSVAHGANDATFQFPCLISNTISIDMASTIARTMEKTYVVFTQSWLSLNPTIDITMDRNILQYLKRFHQNVSLENAVKELLVDDNEVSTYLEKVENGDYVLFTNKNRTFGVVFNTADKVTRTLMESHKDFLEEHLANFDLSPFPYVGDKTFLEADDDLTVTNVAQSMIAAQRAKDEQDQRNQYIKQQTDLSKVARAPQLNDKDVKKENDIAPYAINVRLMAVNDKNEFVQFIEFVLGVKTILHPIPSDEMIANIERVMKNQSTFFKFLRWTTGEISLFKNIILNLDDIKADALQKASGKSPWFGKLKRMKDKKIGIHDLTVPHALIPNATLVISAVEAEYLKNNYGIDITDPRRAKKMVDSLFLMAFIIVDDATGTIEILYDGSTSFQTYALETLEREVSLSSNKLGREIGRMIAH